MGNKVEGVVLKVPRISKPYIFATEVGPTWSYDKSQTKRCVWHIFWHWQPGTSHLQEHSCPFLGHFEVPLSQQLLWHLVEIAWHCGFKEAWQCTMNINDPCVSLISYISKRCNLHSFPHKSTDLGFQNLVCVWNGEPECCLTHRLKHWELLEYILWQTMPPMEFMHWLCWSCLCMLSAMYPASPQHTLSLFLSPIHSITIVWLSVCW